MYLYSNILGTFVFNQNFKIREKIFFKKEELKELYNQMKEGKILKTEKKFLEKFKNVKNLREEHDESALERIYKELDQYRDELREKNIYLTREQIKDTVTYDNLIIQTSDSISELNKAINILVKRLREMYVLVLPELESKIHDNKHFAELVLKPKKELIKEYEIKHTMGGKLGKKDEKEISSLATSVLNLYEEKDRKEKYLEGLMEKNCPNLTTVAGYLTGAKLISHAGSVREMVMMPASTIQLLGAEKALFRHMTRNAKSPKHGLIIEHPLLQQAKRTERGKVARALADKILLAVKVDYFKGDFIGDKLKKELEERFK